MRYRLPILLAVAAAVAALETPLTIAGGNSRVMMIDPAFGSITAFEITQSKSDRQGLGKPNGNFIADAELLLKYHREERDGVPFQALRLGSPNNKPGYGDVFAPGSPLLANKPTKKEVAAGQPALTIRALRAEDAFWKAGPTYDGTVRAAVSSSGQYLAIALPSLHTLMLYKLDNDVATLAAWHNWGPELFVANGFNTPDPREELARLRPAQQKLAYAALGLDDDSKPDAQAPPPVGAATDEPPTPASDIWITAGPGDSFLLVDLLNDRAMLYKWGGTALELKSVRNLKFDLILPGLYEGAVKSAPAGEALLDLFIKSRSAFIKQYGLLTDIDSVNALVGQHQAKAGKASEFEGVMTSGVALLNFCKKRVFLSLNTDSGERLSLVAARDYTLDTAIGLLDQEITDRNAAQQRLKELGGLAKSAPKAGMLTLRLVLSLDPRLHKQAEAAIKGAFKGEQLAEAQALIDEAVKKAEQLVKDAEARAKAAEAARKAREAAIK